MLIKAMLFANPDFIIIVLESYYKIMLHLLKKIELKIDDKIFLIS